MNQFSALPEIGFVRLPAILSVFPVSRSAFWAGVKSGKYPQPVKLSERTTAWRVEEIRALIASYGPAANDEANS
ncbi:MAG: AlpA family phage regulatory protein [Moraxellaceae bacterium]|nr:AlpA family phage regulatory protein [Moraxellaceae bacterium]